MDKKDSDTEEFRDDDFFPEKDPKKLYRMSEIYRDIVHTHLPRYRRKTDNLFATIDVTGETNLKGTVTLSNTGDNDEGSLQLTSDGTYLYWNGAEIPYMLGATLRTDGTLLRFKGDQVVTFSVGFLTTDGTDLFWKGNKIVTE